VTEDALLLIEAPSGDRRVRLGDYLSLEEIERADRSAIDWVKAVRHADLHGQALRERLTYRGDSLWWFVEIYLHRMRVIETLYRAVTASENLFRTERPIALHVIEGDDIARHVLAAGARRHGARYRGATPGRWYDTRRGAALIGKSVLLALGAVMSRFRIGRSAPAGRRERAPIAAFIHSAFWRSSADREAYVGPVLKALVAAVQPEDLVFVGLGPRRTFRARSLSTRVDEWHHAPRDVQAIEGFAPLSAIAGSLAYLAGCDRIRRWLWASPDLRQAAVFEGYDLWRFIRHELLGVAYLQLPWSARAMDEAAAVLDCVRPAVAVTYAEAGGWGRALVLEARRRGITTCGVQHGFIHRHWLNYRHEPDEMAGSAANPGDHGFPCPTKTLLFDKWADAHLRLAGAFPAHAVEVTGNPRLDALAEAARRQTDDTRRVTRERLGVAAGARVIVLATKYRERAHASLAALFAAARDVGGVHLAVRCHPAETAGPYLRLAQGSPTVTIAPADLDLVSLLAAADLVVTVNSTVALEAMALGVPALALNLPNYLSPFVDAGVMIGAGSPLAVAPALSQFLQDESARRAMRARQQAFMAEYEMLPTGQAADSAVRVILDLARGSARVGPAPK
jgi:hypothetical protein